MFFQNDWFSPGDYFQQNIAKEVITFGGFLKWWHPQIIHFNRVFQYKPSILGYPYFWFNIHFVTRLCNDDPWNLWKYHGVGLGWLLQISTRDNVHSIQVEKLGVVKMKQTNKQTNKDTNKQTHRKELRCAISKGRNCLLSPKCLRCYVVFGEGIQYRISDVLVLVRYLSTSHFLQEGICQWLVRDSSRHISPRNGYSFKTKNHVSKPLTEAKSCLIKSHTFVDVSMILISPHQGIVGRSVKVIESTQTEPNVDQFWCSKPSVFVEVETWVFPPPHHMCDIRCFTGECVNNEGHSLTSMLSQQPLEVKVTGFAAIWSYWWWFWNPKANHLGCMKPCK